jgi:threonine/homoserine/homoserine lactone efflux protein
LNNPAALKVIAVCGAAILVYFGVSLLLSLKKASLAPSPEKSKNSHLTMLGITLSLSNPYWAIWWLTIGMGLVLAAQKKGLTGIIVFFLGHIAADLGWYSFVSFSLSRNASRINLRVYKGMLFACALLLIGFGIFFAGYALAGMHQTLNG